MKEGVKKSISLILVLTLLVQLLPVVHSVSATKQTIWTSVQTAKRCP